MDLASPISSVIPSAHGHVLRALSQAGAPLSGRQVAALVQGQVSRSRVNSILGELASQGLVLQERHPPAVVYAFNRSHVAAPFIEGLADLRGALLRRMRRDVEAWTCPAVAVWMFGSAARGDGHAASDIDVLVVRPVHIDADDAVWRAQVSDFTDSVRLWSGNACEMLELTQDELARNVATHSPITQHLSREAVCIGGEDPATLLRVDSSGPAR